MIIENALITIGADQAEAFERAVSECVGIFHAAEGCHGMALARIVDQPGRYRLLVRWDSKAHHAPQFWEPPGFQQWRSRISHFFIETPTLEYNEPVATYF
ncbi:MAG: antibiotic biosynthesis monooxygenase [Sphingobium sp.]